MVGLRFPKSRQLSILKYLTTCHPIEWKNFLERIDVAGIEEAIIKYPMEGGAGVGISNRFEPIEVDLAIIQPATIRGAQGVAKCPHGMVVIGGRRPACAIPYGQLALSHRIEFVQGSIAQAVG